MFKRLLQRWRGTQHSQLTTISVDGSSHHVIHQTREWIEAPNWTPDGQWLVFNGNGKLYRLRADGGGTPEQISTGAIDGITNDHVLSADGGTVFFTAYGRIYSVPFSGGTPQQVSPQHDAHHEVLYYLHGISPDGRQLSCVGVDTQVKTGQLSLYAIDCAMQTAQRLTHTTAALDGPEFSPDGQYIYFNGELNAKRAGHSQLFRMRPNGTEVEQLTFDDRVNWFPHASPDGRSIVYLSYNTGTEGHPANRDVLLRCMSSSGGSPTDMVALFGGQGTINCNSWAPDSQRLAYVAYPFA